jgi:hypothetical protein
VKKKMKLKRLNKIETYQFVLDETLKNISFQFPDGKLTSRQKELFLRCIFKENREMYELRPIFLLIFNIARELGYPVQPVKMYSDYFMKFAIPTYPEMNETDDYRNSKEFDCTPTNSFADSAFSAGITEFTTLSLSICLEFRS